MHRSARLPLTLAAGLVLTVGLAACGDDDAESGSSSDISTIEQWCATVEDIDNRFEVTDNSDDEFSVKQEQYAEINALLHDLTDSIELVDADSRDAVAESIGWAATLTDVLGKAESQEAAEADLFGEEGLFAQQEELSDDGAAWIKEQCNVDIDG